MTVVFHGDEHLIAMSRSNLSTVKMSAAKKQFVHFPPKLRSGASCDLLPASTSGVSERCKCQSLRLCKKAAVSSVHHVMKLSVYPEFCKR